MKVSNARLHNSSVAARARPLRQVRTTSAQGADRIENSSGVLSLDVITRRIFDAMYEALDQAAEEARRIKQDVAAQALAGEAPPEEEAQEIPKKENAPEAGAPAEPNAQDDGSQTTDPKVAADGTDTVGAAEPAAEDEAALAPGQLDAAKHAAAIRFKAAKQDAAGRLRRTRSPHAPLVCTVSAARELVDRVSSAVQSMPRDNLNNLHDFRA